jgi:hypothetical protein
LKVSLFLPSEEEAAADLSVSEINEMLNARVPTRKWTTYVSSLQRDNGGASGVTEPDSNSESDDKDVTSIKHKSDQVQSIIEDADVETQ